MTDDHAERLRYQMELAQSLMRGLLLVNGGAIVALFTFIGESETSFDRTMIWWAFGLFAGGLALTLCATIFGYFSQGSARIEDEKKAVGFEVAGIACVCLALLCFVAGSGCALSGALI